jgi:hypothetical protein
VSTSPQPFRLHVAESAIDGQLGSTECSFEGEVFENHLFAKTLEP